MEVSVVELFFKLIQHVSVQKKQRIIFFHSGILVKNKCEEIIVYMLEK